MTISDIESSLFKYLYDNFEVPLSIKIFESVYYVDFDTFDRWVVMDSLSHSTGPLPKGNFFLHISIKNGLLNDKVVLNRLVDTVTSLIYQGVGIPVYSDATGVYIGDMEVCETNLVPVLQHAGGGSFRSLTVGVLYVGEVHPGL